MKEMLNWGYLKSIKEPYLILKTLFLRRDKSLKKTNRVLIVNAALVGDFMTSLPALATFIKNNKNVKIDLMVSPPIKELAEKIKDLFSDQTILNYKNQ